MNNLEKNMLQLLKNSKINKMLLIYLAFGTVIYIKDYSDLSYINFIYTGIGHPYILSFFLLPVCFIESAYILYSVFNNKNIVGRFDSRRDLFIFQIRIIFKQLNKFFIFFIIILLLSANLFASRENIIISDPNYSNIPNLIGMLFMLLKLYILIITINLISVCTKNVLHNRLYLFISILVIIPFMDFVNVGKFGFLFPCNYVGFKHIYSSFEINIVFSLLYFILVNIVNYIVLKKIIIKKDMI